MNDEKLEVGDLVVVRDQFSHRISTISKIKGFFKKGRGEFFELENGTKWHVDGRPQHYRRGDWGGPRADKATAKDVKDHARQRRVDAATALGHIHWKNAPDELLIKAEALYKECKDIGL